MTHISFTSGELMDLMTIISQKVDQIDHEKDPHLAAYYFDMYDQFAKVLEKVKEFQPENRVANLVLAVN